MKEKKATKQEVKKEVVAPPPVTPSPRSEEIKALNAEIERLRGNVAGLEESLNARGTEVIALRAALEERDKTIAALKGEG